MCLKFTHLSSDLSRHFSVDNQPTSFCDNNPVGSSRVEAGKFFHSRRVRSILSREEALSFLSGRAWRQLLHRRPPSPIVIKRKVRKLQQLVICSSLSKRSRLWASLVAAARRAGSVRERRRINLFVK